jgi:hypothetical protein
MMRCVKWVWIFGLKPFTFHKTMFNLLETVSVLVFDLEGSESKREALFKFVELLSKGDIDTVLDIDGILSKSKRVFDCLGEV